MKTREEKWAELDRKIAKQEAKEKAKQEKERQKLIKQGKLNPDTPAQAPTTVAAPVNRIEPVVTAPKVSEPVAPPMPQQTNGEEPRAYVPRRRLSEEAAEESPRAEISERQWGWAKAGLILLAVAVLVLAGAIYAGYRVNEKREARNALVASGKAGKLTQDVQELQGKVAVLPDQVRMAAMVKATTDSTVKVTNGKIGALTTKLVEFQDNLKAQQILFAGLQGRTDSLTSENARLKQAFLASLRTVAALEAQRVADSTATAEALASGNRKDQAQDQVITEQGEQLKKVGRTATATAGGLAGVLTAGVINLVSGNKNGQDIKPDKGATLGK